MGWVDVHHHILPPAFVATQRAEILYYARDPAVLDWSPGRALEQLDRFGIDTAYTSLGVPGTADPGLARACNEFAADLAREYPARFGVFASLPLPDVDASLSELDTRSVSCVPTGSASYPTTAAATWATRCSPRCLRSSTGWARSSTSTRSHRPRAAACSRITPTRSSSFLSTPPAQSRACCTRARSRGGRGSRSCSPTAAGRCRCSRSAWLRWRR